MFFVWLGLLVLALGLAAAPLVTDRATPAVANVSRAPRATAAAADNDRPVPAATCEACGAETVPRSVGGVTLCADCAGERR